jgi:hypothetical protein
MLSDASTKVQDTACNGLNVVVQVWAGLEEPVFEEGLQALTSMLTETRTQTIDML